MPYSPMSKALRQPWKGRVSLYGMSSSATEARWMTGRSRPLSRKLGWTTFRQPIHMWLAFVFRRGAPLSPAAREMSAIVEERLLIIDRQLRDAPARRLPGG